jgi:hypothetical protein
MNLKSITPEEFRKICKNKDWSGYSNRVMKRINEIADRHEKARNKVFLKKHRGVEQSG